MDMDGNRICIWSASKEGDGFWLRRRDADDINHERFQLSDDFDPDLARRIALCLTFCDGIEKHVLQRLIPGGRIVDRLYDQLESMR